jgi:1-acyl-sn-glycerol-3-phosphate acyltransferase
LSVIAIPFTRGSQTEPINLAATGIIRPYWSGLRDVFQDLYARGSLIGLILWWFAAMTVLAVFLRVGESARVDTIRFLIAMLGGVLLSGLNRHVFRHAGFIVFGPFVAAAGFVWLRCDDESSIAMILIAIASGMTLSPLVHSLLIHSQPKHHGVAASCITTAFGIAGLALAIVVLNLGGEVPRVWLLNFLIVVTAIAALLAAYLLFRPTLELMAETVLWPCYRIRLVGPDAPNLPLHGPCLVIGNHAAWFDPLFVAKVVPAPTTPMMTSKFYDLPVLSFLMRRIIGTIRVPDVPYRHEAPELKEAVAALDRGEYVVLFPEGYLRRKEEIPLRRFGRGVWKILSDRPNTPIFACWIEGNWGSYFSHRGGPPAKGKRFDFFRRIRIGVVGPITIDPATLADQMATRIYLMRQVAAAREPLGLPPIDLQVDRAEDEKE